MNSLMEYVTNEPRWNHRFFMVCHPKVYLPVCLDNSVSYFHYLYAHFHFKMDFLNIILPHENGV